MFTKQLVHETVPTSAAEVFPASLTDTDAVSELLQQHYGYGQWKVIFPGDVQISAKAAQVLGTTYTGRGGPLEDLVLLYHSEDRGRFLKLIAGALQEMRGFHCILRIMTPDGERLIETVADLRIRDGKVVELFGLSRDATMDGRREALSIGRNRMLQELISTMPCPIAVLDEHLNVLECSAYWLRCHKLVDRQDAVGKKFYDLFPATTPPQREEFDRALAGEAIRSKRQFVNPATGAKMDCNTVITRWMAGEEKPGGLVMMIGWSELGVAAAARKVEQVADFDGSLLDLLKQVS